MSRKGNGEVSLKKFEKLDEKVKSLEFKLEINIELEKYEHEKKKELQKEVASMKEKLEQSNILWTERFKEEKVKREEEEKKRKEDGSKIDELKTRCDGLERENSQLKILCDEHKKNLEEQKKKIELQAKRMAELEFWAKQESWVRENKELLENSTLLTTPGRQKTIFKMLETKKRLQKSFSKCQLRLLYRGSRDGMTAKAFHAKCDGKPHTLTIAEHRDIDRLLGGYNSGVWDKECWDQKDDFYFVTNIKGQKFIRFDVLNNQKGTISCDPTYGPCWRSVECVSLLLLSRGTTDGSCCIDTRTCKINQDPGKEGTRNYGGFLDRVGVSVIDITGKPGHDAAHFKISDIEVYQMTFDE